MKEKRSKNCCPENYVSFFGHKFITTRNVTNHSKEYKCSVCDLELKDDLKSHKTFF